MLAAVAIVVVPVQVVSILITLSLPNSTTASTGTTTTTTGDGWPGFAAFLLLLVISVISAALAEAACLKAVSDAYLGTDTDWRGSLRFGYRRLGPLVWLTVIHAVLLLLAFAACIVPGVWLYAAWALAIPALLLEDVRGLKALGRSFSLVRGRWWPTAGILLLANLLASAVALGLGLLALPLLRTGGGNDFVVELAYAVFTAAANVLTIPFISALVTVIYFDLRVRKEGFDLQLMAQRIGAPASDLRPRPGALDPRRPPVQAGRRAAPVRRRARVARRPPAPHRRLLLPHHRVAGREGRPRRAARRRGHARRSPPRAPKRGGARAGRRRGPAAFARREARPRSAGTRGRRRRTTRGPRSRTAAAIPCRPRPSRPHRGDQLSAVDHNRSGSAATSPRRLRRDRGHIRRGRVRRAPRIGERSSLRAHGMASRSRAGRPPMTARLGSWRRLHPAVRVVIVLVVLVVLVNIAVSVLDSSTRGADETAPRSSSLSTGRDGLAAYAELLRQNDHGTEALRGSITDATLVPSDTLVVLDPVGLDDEDARDIRRFVERGGRLVAGGS